MDPKVITEVAWVGTAYVKGPIRGVVLSFHGLGGGLKGGPSAEELEWGRNGGLVVYPYYGPWSWMNRQARAMVDEVVDVMRERKMNVEYVEVDDMGHCGPLPLDVMWQDVAFVDAAMSGRRRTRRSGSLP